MKTCWNSCATTPRSRLGGVRDRQSLPRFTHVEAVSEALTQPSPAQLKPDLIFLLRDAEADRLALLIEVQRRPDPRKLRTWPLYEVMARNRYGCDTLLLILATNARTARWAREPIPMGNSGSIRCSRQPTSHW